jgi:uncharacterized membrane protein YhaH (DUF805 family)
MDSENQTSPSVIEAPPIPVSSLVLPSTTSKKTYFSKLFSGRLNRAGNILGGVFLIFVIMVLSAVSFVPLLIFVNIQIAIAVFLPLVFIVLTFFTASLNIRRLHDLNKSGYLYLILLPGYILSLLNIIVTILLSFNYAASTFSLINIIDNTLFLGIYRIYSYVSFFFGIYLIFWPGTKGDNKYGHPSKHWSIKEIFRLAEPSVLETKKPSHELNFAKLLLKIMLGMIIFVIVLVAALFAYNFIRGFLHI